MGCFLDISRLGCGISDVFRGMSVTKFGGVGHMVVSSPKQRSEQILVDLRAMINFV